MGLLAVSSAVVALPSLAVGASLTGVTVMETVSVVGSGVLGGGGAAIAGGGGVVGRVDGEVDRAVGGLRIRRGVGGTVVGDGVAEAGRSVVVGGRGVGHVAGGQADRAVGVKGGGHSGDGQGLAALVGGARRVVGGQVAGREDQGGVLVGRLRVGVGDRRGLVLLVGGRDGLG